MRLRRREHGGSVTLVLIASSIAMVVMVIKLANQVCGRRYAYEPITDGDQYWKTLKQLLPLTTFPMFFEIPVFIFHVYTTQHSTPNEGMFLAAIVSFSLWSMASGATVIVHISVAQICSRKRKPKPVYVSDIFTQHETSGARKKTYSVTRYSLPPPSV